MKYFVSMYTASSSTQTTPLETSLLKLSSLLELNNFVNKVFKGLSWDTTNNPENTEMARKKLKQALEETEKDIIRQVLITAAPLIFSFWDFYQLSFNRKQSKAKKKKVSPFNLLIERERKFFFLLVPETLFFQTKLAERSFLSFFGDSDFGNRKCWPFYAIRGFGRGPHALARRH